MLDLVGVGEILTGAAAAYGAVQSRLAHRQVKVNGDGEGKTLAGITIGNRDLMQRLMELEGYQHTRNHDILNAIAASRLEPALIERLVEAIEELRPQ